MSHKMIINITLKAFESGLTQVSKTSLFNKKLYFPRKVNILVVGRLKTGLVEKQRVILKGLNPAQGKKKAILTQSIFNKLKSKIICKKVVIP